jgi:hypothetical protein
MIDAGYTPPKSDVPKVMEAGEQKAPEPRYPTFTLEKDNEYLNGKDVGDECMVVARVKLKSVSKGDRYGQTTADNNKPIEYTMQILEIGFKPVEKKQEKEKKKGEAMDEKELKAKESEMESMSNDDLGKKMSAVAKKAKEEDEEEAYV